MGHIGAISFKKMFGEYTISCNGKVITLVCDNQLFLKPTSSVRKMIDTLEKAPPYPGAKPYFQITQHIDDQEWLQEVVLLTARELPEPKPKKRR